MKYFVFSYMPIKNCDDRLMMVFKPTAFESEAEARRYAEIFGILESSLFDVMDEDTFFENFGNLTVGALAVDPV